MKLKLTLTNDQFRALREAADGRGKSAKVDKAALSALLIDHSRALGLVSHEEAE